MSLNVDYAAGDAKMRSKYYYTMNGNYVTNVNQNNQANIKLKQQEGDTREPQKIAVEYNDNVIYPDKVRINCYYYRHGV